jgi:phage tail sheath gpL-like
VTESLVLSLIAGCLGAGCAAAGFHAVVARLPLGEGLEVTLTVDWTLLVLAVGFSLVRGVIVALAPVRALIGGRLQDPGRTRSAGGGLASGPRRAHDALVAAQVALAVLLVAGATIFTRSVNRLYAIDTGFEPAHVTAMNLPVTASPSAGVVTLTAPIEGDSQNGIWRLRADIDSGKGTTVATSGVTLGTGTGTAGADGTTTEAANLTTALAAIVGEPYYYRGIGYKGDTTVLPIVKTHIQAVQAANVNNYCRGIVASNAAKATCQSDAISSNYECVSYIGEPVSEHDPYWLVGQVVSWLQANYNIDSASNLTDGAHEPAITPNWHLKPVYDVADRMDSDDINDLMHDGVTAINSSGGVSRLVSDFTTASKNAAGTIDDARKIQGHVISVGHDLGATINNRGSVSFAGFKIGPDTDPPKWLKRVLTPSIYRAHNIGIFDEFEDAAKIVNVDTVTIPSLVVQQDPDNLARMETTFNFQVISHLRQLTHEANEVTPG